MDRKEINLLPEQAILKREKEKKKQRSLYGLTSVLISLTIIFMIAAFVYSFYLGREAKALTSKIDQEKTKIERNKKKEELLFFTKNKTLALNKILSSRPLHQKRLDSLEMLYSFLPAGSQIDSFVASERIIKITIHFPNSDTIKEFVEKTTDKTTLESLFGNVTISSLAKEKENASYKVDFEITLL
ncbi:hypothetical protein HY439_01180 [Candidatus Microgenomates bacterium]|nr:hypothetical protein [Candidatus Microgenomates bacterium]